MSVITCGPADSGKGHRPGLIQCLAAQCEQCRLPAPWPCAAGPTTRRVICGCRRSSDAKSGGRWTQTAAPGYPSIPGSLIGIGGPFWDRCKPDS
jgi:hypothetical protein